MNRNIVWAAAIAVSACLLLSAGCGERDVASPTPTTTQNPSASSASHEADAQTPAQSAEIHWFDGGVDAAFAEARASERPVFLYWGAAWCPPCNLIKSTVFRRPDFIARTREFVAVYIDGDEPGAQALQDRFHAMGYPTLIVFDPNGKEITRIPGGMDFSRYLDVLELALERIRPVRELLERIVDGQDDGSAAEWRLLASYSWHQDAGRALGGREPLEVLRILARRAPVSAVQDRAALVADYLEMLADNAADATEADRAEAVGLLDALLQDPVAAGSVRPFLGLGAGAVIEALVPAADPRRPALLAAWRNRLGEGAGRAESGAERLWLLQGEVALARLQGGIDPAMRERVRLSVDAELASAGDIYTRSATLNAAVGALDAAGLADRAAEILREQLEDPHFGYYWMLDLAALAEDSGNTREALEWLQRAAQNAEGSATRIQWGSIRVAGMVRMAPADVTGIGDALGKVLDDLESQAKPLHGRNLQAIERMRNALGPWSEGESARLAVLEQARNRLAVLCTSVSGSTEAGIEAQCRDYL